MCAGDLGMYRVMPWSYPPISGGSSGGFSPDDSGTGGGVSVLHSFRMGDDSTIWLYSVDGIGTTSNDLQISFRFIEFEIENVQGVSSVAYEFDLEKLELWRYSTLKAEDMTSKVTSCSINWVSKPPFDTLTNDSSGVNIPLHVFLGESQTWNDILLENLTGTFRLVSKDEDGETIRADSFRFSGKLDEGRPTS